MVGVFNYIIVYILRVFCIVLRLVLGVESVHVLNLGARVAHLRVVVIVGTAELVLELHRLLCLVHWMFH